jgi:hypothetical protein
MLEIVCEMKFALVGVRVSYFGGGPHANEPLKHGDKICRR